MCTHSWTCGDKCCSLRRLRSAEKSHERSRTLRKYQLDWPTGPIVWTDTSQAQRGVQMRRSSDELRPRNGNVPAVAIVARISGCANQKELSLEDGTGA